MGGSVIRRFAVLVLTCLALAGIIPGAREALEQVGEWVEHGHLAHSAPGERDAGADEHGCTPIQHRCPCHEGQSVAVYGLPSGANWSAEWLMWMLPRSPARAMVPVGQFVRPATTEYVSRANAPPTPPPNA